MGEDEGENENEGTTLDAWEPAPGRWSVPVAQRQCPDGAVCSLCREDQPCRRILVGQPPRYAREGDARWKQDHVEAEVARARRVESVAVAVEVVLWCTVEIPELADERMLEDLLEGVQADQLADEVGQALEAATSWSSNSLLGKVTVHSVDGGEARWARGVPLANPTRGDVPSIDEMARLPGMPGLWATDGTMLVRADVLAAGLVLRTPSRSWIKDGDLGDTAEMGSFVCDLLDPLSLEYAWEECVGVSVLAQLSSDTRNRIRPLLGATDVSLMTCRRWLGVFDRRELALADATISLRDHAPVLRRALVALVGMTA